MTRYTLEDILNRLGLRAAKMALRTIALADGVRVGNAWLGHPRFLPVINGADGDPKVTDASGGVAHLSCVNGALIASGPVDGDFIISEKTGRWLRRASFVTLATLHAEMDGAAYRLPEQENGSHALAAASGSGRESPVGTKRLTFIRTCLRQSMPVRGAASRRAT